MGVVAIENGTTDWSEILNVGIDVSIPIRMLSLEWWGCVRRGDGNSV